MYLISKCPHCQGLNTLFLLLKAQRKSLRSKTSTCFCFYNVVGTDKSILKNFLFARWHLYRKYTRSTKYAKIEKLLPLMGSWNAPEKMKRVTLSLYLFWQIYDSIVLFLDRQTQSLKYVSRCLTLQFVSFKLPLIINHIQLNGKQYLFFFITDC